MPRNVMAISRRTLSGVVLLSLGLSGCNGHSADSPTMPVATIPLMVTAQTPPMATLSSSVAYMNNTRVEMTLTSTAFNVTDSIVSAQPYDSTMTALTPWTIINQAQDTTGTTITVVFKTGDGKASVAPSATKKPEISAPLITTTVTITSNNGVVAKIPMKPVGIDPCL